MVQNLLSQFLEALQQALRGPTLFSPQRRHEEVEVIKQGHVIICVRLCHLEQLSPTVLNAHACQTHWHNTQILLKGSRESAKTYF